MNPSVAEIHSLCFAECNLCFLGVNRIHNSCHFTYIRFQLCRIVLHHIRTVFKCHKIHHEFFFLLTLADNEETEIPSIAVRVIDVQMIPTGKISRKV
jgi:hypothetical protein